MISHHIDRAGFVLCALLLLACGPEDVAPMATEAHEDEHGDHDDHAHAQEGEPAEDEHAEDSVTHEGEVQVDPELAAQQGILTDTASRRRLVPTIITPARVALNQESFARVVSPVEGRVAELILPVGADVAAGNPLAVIHSPDFATAQRGFARASAALAAVAPLESLANERWQRAVELNAQQGEPALAEVQIRESDYRRLQAERIDAEGSFLLQRDTLALWGLSKSELDALLAGGEPHERYILRAPIDGRIIERGVAIGDQVGPDDAPAATIADFRELWVLANFPESRLRELRQGASAQIRLESDPDHGCPGIVTLISPVLDLTNRTVEVRIVPEDRHDDLRPGQFARAEIELTPLAGEVRDDVAVPESAIVRLDGVDVVFVPVANEPGTFVARPVRVGRVVKDWAPILEGLAEGELYVREGAFLLKAEAEKSEGGHDH